MKIFYVDLPDPRNESEDASYVNIDVCRSKAEARKLLKERYRMPRKIADFFITEGDDGV